MREISEAALAGTALPDEPQPSDLLLRGLALQATQGYAAGAPLVKEALNAFECVTDLAPNDARWLWLASLIALFSWDDHAWTALFTRQVDLARRTGALSALAYAVGNGVGVYAFFGDLRTASSLREELRTITEATGIAPGPRLHPWRLQPCAVARQNFRS